LNRGGENYRAHGPHGNRGNHDTKSYATREDKRSDSFGAGIL